MTLDEVLRIAGDHQLLKRKNNADFQSGYAVSFIRQLRLGSLQELINLGFGNAEKILEDAKADDWEIWDIKNNV